MLRTKQQEQPVVPRADLAESEASLSLHIERGQIFGIIGSARAGTLSVERLLDWLAAPGSRMLVSGREVSGDDSGVLMCDDPTPGFDRAATERALSELERANRRFGLTIVIVTDSPQVIRRVCHAAAVVDRGRVIEQIHLQDLLAVPRSELGRALLGRPPVPRAVARRACAVLCTS